MDKCLELREISLSILTNQQFDSSVEFVKNSYGWKHIFKFADSIKEMLIKLYSNKYDLTPINL